MKHESWEWEVRSMQEGDPYVVHTTKDDALQAMTNFTETWGQVSIYSLRKTAKIIRYEDAI
ncbi:hypothetical protein [Sporosarcina sp. FA9]|uniref:hypothetical protein n=1 Tax=Sporosarcina sp. FA9 TaxID=3413030 RepID=UPI003F65E8BF